MLHRITNWDDAYDNGNNIASGHRWPALWADAAEDYRTMQAKNGSIELDRAYGADSRQKFDLIQPQLEPLGLVVFVHGGFWHKFDKSYFTHLARGSVDSGWAVAIPSYRLCPDVSINEIIDDVSQAIISAAARVSGPIRLIGHSAGGHLVAMMITSMSLLPAELQARVEHVVSVSGLHDLRPMLNLSMNRLLQIDPAQAAALSPALLSPIVGKRITCWVGASERS